MKYPIYKPFSNFQRDIQVKMDDIGRRSSPFRSRHFVPPVGLRPDVKVDDGSLASSGRSIVDEYQRTVRESQAGWGRMPDIRVEGNFWGLWHTGGCGCWWWWWWWWWWCFLAASCHSINPNHPIPHPRVKVRVPIVTTRMGWLYVSAPPQKKMVNLQ